MGPGKDDFGLRLTAKAADREKAAGQEWPAFEERLKKLGYGPRAIAHAFRTLSGPGTVAEALKVLNDMSRPESHPVALSFEVTPDGRLRTARCAQTQSRRPGARRARSCDASSESAYAVGLEASGHPSAIGTSGGLRHERC
jgi:hypothetical protein